MRMRLGVAGLAAVIVLGGGASFAQHHPNSQPSQHCDGSTPGSPPVEVKVDLARPAVCENLHPALKGAVWADMATGSVVFDGDSTNNQNRCSDGYVGVRADDDPNLVYSPGANYDPNASESDGGSNGNGAGSSNDPFTQDEAGELASCFVG